MLSSTVIQGVGCNVQLSYIAVVVGPNLQTSWVEITEKRGKNRI